MMYKATYSQYYSTLQEIPYGLWNTGEGMPQFPYQWNGRKDGDKNPFYGLLFDPMLCPSDGQDGCLRHSAGGGPYKTADFEVAWCEDDFLNIFWKIFATIKMPSNWQLLHAPIPWCPSGRMAMGGGQSTQQMPQNMAQ